MAPRLARNRCLRSPVASAAQPPQPPRIVLGSGSPRRRHFLEQLGIEFQVLAPDIDETPLPHEAPTDYVLRLAVGKADAVVKLLDPAPPEPTLVIAADTIVAHGSMLLGKPTDPAEASQMLRLLSGTSHHVHTGVAVQAVPPQQSAGGADCQRAVSSTEVTFAELTDADIAWYVASGEPRDKAGAYGIHALAGRFVESISGNYQSVVGLPLTTLEALLVAHGTSLTELSTASQ